MNFTPSFCQVDLGAIAANFRALGQPARLMPVIKANAYGHGLLPVAKILDAVGATRFAVGIAKEGAVLRTAGFAQQIVLLMGCHTAEDWHLAVSHRLVPILGSREDVEAARGISLADDPLAVAIKCDSGMGRLGFAPADAAAVIELLRQAPGLRPIMVISHLACADMPEEDSYTASQICSFRQFHAALAEAFPGILPSLGNSAATLSGMPEDIGRPGLALYGGDPFGPDHKSPLRWAMAVAAPIIHVRELAPGQCLSYGKTFIATRPMHIAVVACGYATGYSRNLSGRAQMLVRGQRFPQVGRVCMGMTMLDVSSVPDLRPGELAWLMGGNPAPGVAPLTAWELADLLDTIPYEILCRFGSMNDTIYLNG